MSKEVIEVVKLRHSKFLVRCSIFIDFSAVGHSGSVKAVPRSRTSHRPLPLENTYGDSSQSERKVKGVFKRGLTALFSWCKVQAKRFCLTRNNPNSPNFQRGYRFRPFFHYFQKPLDSVPAMTTRDKDRFEKKIARMRADQERLRNEIALLRKQNREAARALNQREALLHSMPAGFIVLEKARIAEANDFILGRLGYSIEDVLGHPFADFVHPRLKNVTRDFQRRRASGKWAPDEYETDLVAKNGDVLSCDVRVRKVRRRGRTAFLLMLTPSEERKKREKDLVESRKGESLGRMAHEITTRLQAYLERGSAGDGVERSRRVGRFQRATPTGDTKEQILRIAESLGSFTKEAPDPSRKSFVDLRRVVREAVACVSPMLNDSPEAQGSGIHLKTYLRAVSPVEGDSEEIEEMLSHVMFNAVEAMPHGGDLYLSIEENAGQAHIYIQDSGVGIAPEILDKVFDPFFTTKEDGRPGLGLCVAQAIAKRHKGTLEVSSKKNEGTVVTIRLPLATASPRKPRKRRKASEVHILLVEEDGMVRDLLYKMLDHKGYRVSTVSTGTEALQHLERKTFDAVIVGSGTPDMKVQNLIREIKRKKTDLSVAWITGDEGSERKPKEKGPAVDLLISKPIDMTSTLAKLSELLAG
jgi:PAS domain S-box-containing protein